MPVQAPKYDKIMYKSGGVYVVIGGAGGIGASWSEHMIRTYQARIVWIGRRQKDEAIKAKLDRFAALEAAPHYIAADATDQKALRQAYEEIKERYSQINGVIHAAIILLDQSLVNMDEERFRAGLAAKVDVSVRIAQVFHKEPLDFVLFFSSFNSFLKSPGQSNYVSGCTFKDAFARRLSQEWDCAVKVMNWGYWGSTGIVASKAYQDRMAQAGIDSIEPPEGMAALETLLAGPMEQIAFMKTTKSLALEGMTSEELISVYPGSFVTNIQAIKDYIPNTLNIKKALAASFSTTGNDNGTLLDNVKTVLTEIALKLLMVKSEHIDGDAELSEYGLDPIKLTEFANKLNQKFSLELAPTIFFEYPTLNSFAAYLVEEYEDVFVKRFPRAVVNAERQGNTKASKLPFSIEEVKAVLEQDTQIQLMKSGEGV